MHNICQAKKKGSSFSFLNQDIKMGQELSEPWFLNDSTFYQNSENENNYYYNYS